MADPGLFDVPESAYLIPPEPEDLSRGERRKRLVAIRILSGLHPLGYVGLHEQAARVRGGEGLTCGDCVFRDTRWHHGKSYPKCFLPTQVGDRTVYPRETGGESSDIRAWWPACTDFKPKD